MSDDNKSKKINTDKIEEIPFEMVTGHESTSVKTEDLNPSDQQEGGAWSNENQTRLEDLKKNIETRKSKLRELDRNIQDLTSKKIDRMGAVSYSESQIKESMENLIKNIKEIKKINSFELKGVGDFIEAKIDINAEKKTFLKTIKAGGAISLTFGNQEGRVVVKKHSVKGHGFGDETLINTKLKPELPRVPELLKDYIENKEGNYTKRIFIENGELKAEFDTPETETGVTEKLEKLELERKTEESLLNELRKNLTTLEEEKRTTLNLSGEDDTPPEQFELKKYMEVPMSAKIEKKIWECSTESDLENLVTEIKGNIEGLSEEDKLVWNDIEPVLQSEKEELLNILGLWKEWARNDSKPELQNWSKHCLNTLGKAMKLENEPEERAEETLEVTPQEVDTEEKESFEETPGEMTEMSDEEKLLNNKKLDIQEIENKISNLNKSNPLFEVRKTQLEKEKAEIIDYYDSRIKNLGKTEGDTNESEHIPLIYDTEKYEIYITNHEGIKEEVKNILEKALIIRKISIEDIETKTSGDNLIIAIKLKEDSYHGNKFNINIELVNYGKTVAVKELKEENSIKLAEKLSKEVRDSVREVVDKMIHQAENKQGKSRKTIQIKEGNLEVIFDK